MSAVLHLPGPEGVSLAVALRRLGDVPPERISLLAPIGGCTEERYIEILESKRGLFELVDGTLVEKAMAWLSNYVGAVILSLLMAHVRANGLGIVLGEAGAARISGQVRMPDAAFYPWSRFPEGKPPPPGPVLGAVPDLAVEVMSPANTAGEMERKRREYFAGGARLVWEVEPELRLVRVYTSPDAFTAVNEAGTLDGAPVLPGFRVAVRELFTFEDARPQPAPLT